MTVHDDTAFLLSIFLVEAWETVAALESGLPRLDAPPDVAAEVVESLGIVAHRLKGAASLHGFSAVAALAGAIEERLEAWESLDEATRRDSCRWLAETTAAIGAMLDRLGAGLGDGMELEAGSIAATEPIAPVGSAVEPPETAVIETAPPAPDVVRRFLEDHPEVAAFFLPEAAEHLDAIGRVLADLETEPSTP
jgi:chemotaxis protein histidine kinase CheA